MNSAKAFAPANISCIFKIFHHKNPRWMGSYGVGFTLNKGVIADASIASRNEVIFNNRLINFPTVMSLIKKLTNKKIRIDIKSNLPLGCGFGLSGASALASSYAINKLLRLKKSNKELAIISHIAEVENKTGLGDVVNQFYGGFCMKLKPSSYFSVKKLPMHDIDVYCRYFSKISTKSVIANSKLRKAINTAADNSLKNIESIIRDKNKRVQFKDIIKISKEFAVKSALLHDIKTISAIKNIAKNNGNASMIMLGNAVFSDKHFAAAMKLKISNKGAHLL